MNIDKELDGLVLQLKECPMLGRISRHDLSKILKNYQTLILFEQDTIKGFAGYKKLTHNYCEISPIFVKREYQGQGLGKLLLQEFVTLHSTKNILACTRNDILIKLLLQNGFVETSLLQQPFKVIISHLLSVKLYRIYDNYKKGIMRNWRFFIKKV